MRKLIVLFCCLLISLVEIQGVQAQAATVTYEGMPYSFIAKDSTGQRLANIPNAAVNLKVRESSPAGQVLYEESNTLAISADGVATGVLGEGSAIINVFNTVDFGNGQEKFLEITLQGTPQGVVQLYTPKVETNSKVKTINQANHQSIVLNDGDWVTVEGTIVLSSNYSVLSSAKDLLIKGGSFEGSGTGSTTLDIEPVGGGNSSITGVHFKDMSIRSNVNFSNCTFENVSFIADNISFNGCAFTGNIGLGSSSNGFEIYNSNIYKANFFSVAYSVIITNSKIDSTSFGILRSVSNSRIKASTFSNVFIVSNNTIDNSQLAVVNVFSGNRCNASSISNISNYSSYNPLTITGNTFWLNKQGEDNCIFIGLSSINISQDVVVSDNLFFQYTNPTTPVYHIKLSGAGNTTRSIISILGNQFSGATRVIEQQTLSINTRAIVKNNTSTILISLTGSQHIINNNHTL